MSKLSESLASIGAPARLYTSAAAILREVDLDLNRATPKFVSIVKSDEALLTALARNFLNGVAADMRNTAATATQAEAVEATDHGHGEAQSGVVGSHPSLMAAEANLAEAAEATDHRSVEAHRGTVGGPPSTMAATAEQANVVAATDQVRIETQPPAVGGHPSMPTAQQRAAERALSRSTTLFDTWKMRGTGRKVGNILMHELYGLADYSARKAGQYVDKSKSDLINGIAFKLIAEHAPNANPMAKVRDVINEATLKRIRKKAEKEADQVLTLMKAIIPTPAQIRSVA